MGDVFHRMKRRRFRQIEGWRVRVQERLQSRQRARQKRCAGSVKKWIRSQTSQEAFGQHKFRNKNECDEPWYLGQGFLGSWRWTVGALGLKAGCLTDSKSSSSRGARVWLLKSSSLSVKQGTYPPITKRAKRFTSLGELPWWLISNVRGFTSFPSDLQIAAWRAAEACSWLVELMISLVDCCVLLQVSPSFL